MKNCTLLYMLDMFSIMKFQPSRGLRKNFDSWSDRLINVISLSLLHNSWSQKYSPTHLTEYYTFTYAQSQLIQQKGQWEFFSKKTILKKSSKYSPLFYIFWFTIIYYLWRPVAIWFNPEIPAIITVTKASTNYHAR